MTLAAFAAGGFMGAASTIPALWLLDRLAARQAAKQLHAGECADCKDEHAAL